MSVLYWQFVLLAGLFPSALLLSTSSPGQNCTITSQAPSQGRR